MDIDRSLNFYIVPEAEYAISKCLLNEGICERTMILKWKGGLIKASINSDYKI